MRLFGYVKDLEDPLDYPAELLVPTAIPLPASYRVDKKAMIYNQGYTPRCVTYAASGCKTDEEYLQYGQRMRFDADWLFEQCKKIDGIPNQPGTYPRIACKVMAQHMALLGGQPSAKWKIDAYYRIAPNAEIATVKQIIYEYGSLLFACMWYTSWLNASLRCVFPKPDSKEGPHATRVIGWDSRGMIIANNHGKFPWGWFGVSTMPYEMFIPALAEGDCWKLVDCKTA